MGFLKIGLILLMPFLSVSACDTNKPLAQKLDDKTVYLTDVCQATVNPDKLDEQTGYWSRHDFQNYKRLQSTRQAFMLLARIDVQIIERVGDKIKISVIDPRDNCCEGAGSEITDREV